MQQSIKYLSGNEIDVEKWDRRVDESSNGMIYARAAYLDNMAKNWDAIVLNDYAAIMPIPYRKKFNIKYAFHPPFIQQLGIIGEANRETQNDILQLAFRKIRYGDFLFNFSNVFAKEFKTTRICTNLILPLNDKYETIENSFKKDALNNIRRAAKFNLQYLPENDLPLAIELFEKEYHPRVQHLKKEDFNQFKKLTAAFQKTQNAFTRKVLNESGETIAAALFLIDNKRIYNLANTTSEAGRQVEANYFLLASLIREFAGQKLILDFEGSDLPGVQAFYKKFTTENQPFFLYRHNALPFPIRWLAG